MSKPSPRPMPTMAATDGDDGLPLLTLDEAAERIRFSTSWLYKRVADGSAPARRVGRSRAIRFKQSDLAAWMQLADRTDAA